MAPFLLRDLDDDFSLDVWYLLRALVLGGLLVGVLIGLPFAGALCYEFLELTGAGRSILAALAMVSVLGVAVMLLASITACTVPTLRAWRIAPMDAPRRDAVVAPDVCVDRDSKR